MTPPVTPSFRPAATGDAATTFRCPLCGMRFSHGEEVCGSCPLRAGCDVVGCPGCGYTFPRTSLIVEWARRLWRRTRAARGAEEIRP